VLRQETGGGAVVMYERRPFASGARQPEYVPAHALATRPAPTWLIDGILQQNSTAVLYGQSGLGKSLLALSLSVHIAAGMAWNGRAVESGPVVYLAYEGEAGLSVRFNSLVLKLGLNQDIVSTLPLGFILNPGPLFNVTVLDTLLNSIGKMNPKLVVVDTIGVAMTGGNEDATSDMAILVAHLNALRNELQTTVLGLHHPLKNDPTTMRGSGALYNSFDTVLHMRADGKPNSVTLVCKKQRDGARFEPSIRLIRRSGSFPTGAGAMPAAGQEKWHVIQPASESATESVRPDDLPPAERSAILDMIPETETIAAGEWWRQVDAAKLGIAKRTFERRVKDLLTSGAIEQITKGKYRRLLPASPDGRADDEEEVA
jgi:hypothetical protein